MESIEELHYQLLSSGIALELLGGVDAEGIWRQGVRLRTFGRQVPKHKMVMASGDSFEEAANEAVAKAKERRWEALDWGARPWNVRTGGGDAFGVGP